MKINITPLLRDPHDVLEIEFLGEQAIPVENFGDYQFTGPLEFRGELLSEDSGVLRLKGESSIPYKTHCVRCVEEIEDQFSVRVDERIYPDDYKQKLMEDLNLSEEEGNQLFPHDEEDPDDLVFHNRSYVELEKFLVDYLILSLPIGQYCEANCPGLCVQCGRKLDDPDCKCQEVLSEDSPFAKLKELL